MNSSFFITLIALAVVGAIAYFSAVGFRGAGKIKKVPRNLQKYLPDDELETTHLDNCLLYTSPSPRDLSTARMPSSA